MALESCICLAQDKHHIPKTSQQLYRIDKYCLPSPRFPSSALAQTLHSPQSLSAHCVQPICSSGWVTTWQKAQSSVRLASWTILQKGQMIPRSTTKEGGETCQEIGWRTVPFNGSELKYPCYILQLLLQLTHSRICFHMQIPTWFK